MATWAAHNRPASIALETLCRGPRDDQLVGADEDVQGPWHMLDLPKMEWRRVPNPLLGSSTNTVAALATVGNPTRRLRPEATIPLSQARTLLLYRSSAAEVAWFILDTSRWSCHGAGAFTYSGLDSFDQPPFYRGKLRFAYDEGTELFAISARERDVMQSKYMIRTRIYDLRRPGLELAVVRLPEDAFLWFEGGSAVVALSSGVITHTLRKVLVFDAERLRPMHADAGGPVKFHVTVFRNKARALRSGLLASGGLDLDISVREVRSVNGSGLSIAGSPRLGGVPAGAAVSFSGAGTVMAGDASLSSWLRLTAVGLVEQVEPEGRQYSEVKVDRVRAMSLLGDGERGQRLWVLGTLKDGASFAGVGVKVAWVTVGGTGTGECGVRLVALPGTEEARGYIGEGHLKERVGLALGSATPDRAVCVVLAGGDVLLTEAM